MQLRDDQICERDDEKGTHNVGEQAGRKSTSHRSPIAQQRPCAAATPPRPIPTRLPFPDGFPLWKHIRTISSRQAHPVYSNVTSTRRPLHWPPGPIESRKSLQWRKPVLLQCWVPRLQNISLCRASESEGAQFVHHSRSALSKSTAIRCRTPFRPKASNGARQYTTALITPL